MLDVFLDVITAMWLAAFPWLFWECAQVSNDADRELRGHIGMLVWFIVAIAVFPDRCGLYDVSEAERGAQRVEEMLRIAKRGPSVAAYEMVRAR